MANNELALMQWQAGTQTTFADDVAPTVKLMGAQDGEVNALVPASVVEESRASLAPAYEATVDSQSGEATVPGDANYEQIAYYLDSLFGKATPGSGPGYSRAYAAPLLSVPSPRILTLVRGSAVAVAALKGAICNTLTFKAELNKRLSFEAGFIGHSVVTSRALSVLSDTSPTPIHSNQAAIMLDTWGGTMGATAFTPAAYSIEFGFDLAKFVQMGIGSPTPLGHKIGKGDAGSNQVKVSMELDAASAAYYAAVISPSGVTPFKCQFQVTFSSGSLSLQLQFAGFTPEAPKFVSDSDGVSTLEFVLSPLYHASFANWFKATLINSIADLA